MLSGSSWRPSIVTAGLSRRAAPSRVAQSWSGSLSSPHTQRDEPAGSHCAGRVVVGNLAGGVARPCQSIFLSRQGVSGNHQGGCDHEASGPSPGAAKRCVIGLSQIPTPTTAVAQRHQTFMTTESEREKNLVLRGKADSVPFQHGSGNDVSTLAAKGIWGCSVVTLCGERRHRRNRSRRDSTSEQPVASLGCLIAAPRTRPQSRAKIITCLSNDLRGVVKPNGSRAGGISAIPPCIITGTPLVVRQSACRPVAAASQQSSVPQRRLLAVKSCSDTSNSCDNNNSSSEHRRLLELRIDRHPSRQSRNRDFSTRRKPAGMAAPATAVSASTAHSSNCTSSTHAGAGVAEPVYLRVYDISDGAASTWSLVLLGKKFEGVWHTGVEVYGMEYFYGGGIVKMKSCDVESSFGIRAVRTHFLGSTSIGRNEFERYLLSIQSGFTRECYDLIKWNCNNFTDLVAKYLLNTGIPSYILDLPEELTRTFMGKIIVNFIKMFSDAPLIDSDAANHPKQILLASGAVTSSDQTGAAVQRTSGRRNSCPGSPMAPGRPSLGGIKAAVSASNSGEKEQVKPGRPRSTSSAVGPIRPFAGQSSTLPSTLVTTATNGLLSKKGFAARSGSVPGTAATDCGATDGGGLLCCCSGEGRGSRSNASNSSSNATIELCLKCGRRIRNSGGAAASDFSTNCSGTVNSSRPRRSSFWGGATAGSGMKVTASGNSLVVPPVNMSRSTLPSPGAAREGSTNFLAKNVLWRTIGGSGAAGPCNKVESSAVRSSPDAGATPVSSHVDRYTVATQSRRNSSSVVDSLPPPLWPSRLRASAGPSPTSVADHNATQWATVAQSRDIRALLPTRSGVGYRPPPLTARRSSAAAVVFSTLPCSSTTETTH